MHDYAHSTDPEAQLQEQLSSIPNAPQWARDRIERKTRRCLALATHDPFAGLPARKGGYGSSYWYAQALTDGDPLAQEQAAADALAKIDVAQNMPEPAKRELLDVATEHLRAAVESGDPTALYAAGMLLSNGRYTSEPLNGVAVSLAACDLGYDCSAGNPQNVFSNCRLSGDCPADASYAYYLQQSLGPAKYAQVYAHAMDIEQSVRDGDWNAVMKTLTVKFH